MVLRSEFAVKTCKGNKCVQFITLKYIHSITTFTDKHFFLKSELTVNCIGKIIDTNPWRRFSIEKPFRKGQSNISICATLEKRRELEPKLNVKYRKCFRDRNWRRADQLLANFFPCPWQQSQKSLRKLTRPSSLYVLKWRMANKQPN